MPFDTQHVLFCLSVNLLSLGFTFHKTMCLSKCENYTWATGSASGFCGWVMPMCSKSTCISMW